MQFKKNYQLQLEKPMVSYELTVESSNKCVFFCIFMFSRTIITCPPRHVVQKDLTRHKLWEVQISSLMLQLLLIFKYEEITLDL